MQVLVIGPNIDGRCHSVDSKHVELLPTVATSNCLDVFVP